MWIGNHGKLFYYENIGIAPTSVFKKRNKHAMSNVLAEKKKLGKKLTNAAPTLVDQDKGKIYTALLLDDLVTNFTACTLHF